MDAPFVTARLLNSVLIGLGDLVLISIFESAFAGPASASKADDP